MDTLELHVLGLGDAPDKLIGALMEDQLRAVDYQPVSLILHRIAGTQAIGVDLVAQWAEGYEGLKMDVKEYRDIFSFSDEFGHRLWTQENLSQIRVLIFWDESRTTQWAAQVALDRGIEVRSLTDVLAEIASISEDNNERTQQDMPSKTAVYTEDQLREMDEPEITAVAEAYGVDHESYETWEPVIEMILEAQGGLHEEEVVAEEEGDSAEEEEEEEFNPYTRAQLEAMELDTLKQICEINEIHVEGQRPRLRKYVEAILEAQGGEPEAGEEPEEEPQPEPQPEGDTEGDTEEEESEQVLSEESPGVDLSVVVEPLENLTGSVAALEASVAEVASSQIKVLAALNQGLERLSKAVTTLSDKVENLGLHAPGTTKTAETTRIGAAPVKSAGAVKKLVRPKA